MNQNYSKGLNDLHPKSFSQSAFICSFVCSFICSHICLFVCLFVCSFVSSLFLFHSSLTLPLIFHLYENEKCSLKNIMNYNFWPLQLARNIKGYFNKDIQHLFLRFGRLVLKAFEHFLSFLRAKNLFYMSEKRNEYDLKNMLFES